MIANALSILRMLLAPVLLFCLQRDSDATASLTTLLVLLVAALSDLADGFFARHYHQTSQLGRILDPLADKLFVGSLGLGLYLWRGFPLWLLAGILLRDAAIVLVGSFLLRAHDLVISPNYYGKYATAILILTGLAHLVPAAAPVRVPLAYIAGIMLITSSVSYVFLLRRTLTQLRAAALDQPRATSRSA